MRSAEPGLGATVATGASPASVRSAWVVSHTVRRKLTIVFLALIACGLALPVYYYLVDRTDHSLTWGARLRDRLEHCDEIVISSGSPYEDKANRRLLFRSTDRGVITNLVSSIRTHDASSGVHCGCSGDPTLEFYHGWNKLATVGVHHGQLLRWDDGWDGDGVLTPEASKEFVALLKQHGLSDEDLR